MPTARRRWRWLPRASTWVALVIGIEGLLSVVLGVVLMAAPDRDVLKAEVGRQQVTVVGHDEVSGLVQIVSGILLLLLGKGLLERRRRAWGAALLVLSAGLVPSLFGVVQQVRIDALAPHLLSVVLIVVLLVFRRTFDVRATRLSYGQIIAVIAVVLALAYGIIGSYLLRNQFTGLESWSDAVYFTLVTYSTLGYDFDIAAIYPVRSDARWFTVSMFLIGVSLLVTALSVALGPIVEGRVKGMMHLVKRFHKLDEHVVVCGYSGVAASVIDELQERSVSVVVVDDREKIVQLLRGKGLDVLEGDPTLRETLVEANVATARAVIATFDSDSMNTMVAVNAKDLRDAGPDVGFAILVRIEDEENVDKVRRLGVDQVISPSTLGGRLLAVQAVERAEPRNRTPPEA